MGAELANSHPPVTVKPWEAAGCLMSISGPCPNLGIAPPSSLCGGSWALGLHTLHVALKGLLPLSKCQRLGLPKKAKPSGCLVVAAPTLPLSHLPLWGEVFPINDSWPPQALPLPAWFHLCNHIGFGGPPCGV